MATRDQDEIAAFFFKKEPTEVIDIIQKQMEIKQRLVNANKQINEIESYIRDGPDAIERLRITCKYDEDKFNALRKRLYELLSKQSV